MQQARSLRLLVAAHAALGLEVAAVPVRAGSPAEIGTVLAIKGRPTLATGARRLAPLAALDALRDDDRLSLASGDYVRFCDERAGKLVEIAGPGTVTLAPGGPVRSGGTPLVTVSRHCDASAAADADGGVLLRAMPRRPPR